MQCLVRRATVVKYFIHGLSAHYGHHTFVDRGALELAAGHAYIIKRMLFIYKPSRACICSYKLFTVFCRHFNRRDAIAARAGAEVGVCMAAMACSGVGVYGARNALRRTVNVRARKTVLCAR